MVSQPPTKWYFANILCVCSPEIYEVVCSVSENKKYSTMEYYVRQTCGRAGGRSHRISPPSFCDASLNIYLENDSAVLVLFQLVSAKKAN